MDDADGEDEVKLILVVNLVDVAKLHGKVGVGGQEFGCCPDTPLVEIEGGHMSGSVPEGPETISPHTASSVQDVLVLKRGGTHGYHDRRNALFKLNFIPS